MYAIVRIGGKQYRAEEGRTLVVEKLPHEVGDTVEFDQVLVLSDGEATQIGQPLVPGVTVSAQVVDQFKGKKIIVFKYRFKKRYRRKQGHRQNYTRLAVNHIGGARHEEPHKARASRKKAVEAEAPSEPETPAAEE
jgi:large subunit ribosomal protein L21